jgi:hypothetical protein
MERLLGIKKRLMTFHQFIWINLKLYGNKRCYYLSNRVMFLIQAYHHDTWMFPAAKYCLLTTSYLKVTYILACWNSKRKLLPLWTSFLVTLWFHFNPHNTASEGHFQFHCICSGKTGTYIVRYWHWQNRNMHWALRSADVGRGGHQDGYCLPSSAAYCCPIHSHLNYYQLWLL